MNWILFLSQLPTNPSSLRVMVWRKMKAAGALGIQNGVWMLPELPEQTDFARQLLSSIQRQNAGGQIFRVQALDDDIEQDILARFRCERDEEYGEFCERCQGLVDEIEKETAVEKFTFAELEENEQDLQKLEKWIKKINQRDFIGTEKAAEAARMLSDARSAFDEFTGQVYARQGIDTSDSSSTERYQEESHEQ